MNRKQVLTLTGFMGMFLLLFAVAFSFSLQSKEPSEREHPNGKSSSTLNEDSAAQVPAASGPQTVKAGGKGNSPGARVKRRNYAVSQGEPAGFTAEESLNSYREYARYPHLERPLTEANRDLIYPYDADWGGKPVPRSDIMCNLKPESTIYTGQGDFKVTLRCYRPGEQNNLPINVNKVQVLREHGGGFLPALPPISSGHEGDYVYTFLVRHRSVDWGEMRIVVDITVGGIRYKDQRDWFSTPNQPAEFITDAITDSKKEGHLIVTVPVNVNRPGYYEFNANLQEARAPNRYIARTAWRGELLESGLHEIPLRFFGKVLYDQAIDGPYLMQQLRGRRLNQAVTPAVWSRYLNDGVPLPKQQDIDQPEYEYMEPASVYESEISYRASEFSDKEWESLDKMKRLKFLEEMAQ